MKIQRYLFIVFFVVWTVPLHAVLKNATGKKRVANFDMEVTGGVPGEDGAYIYDNGDIAITMSDADRHSGNWLYFYTSDPTVAPDDPGNIYTYIGDGAPESQTRLRILSFKNDVLPLKNQPGYYYIKEASSSQYAKIIVAGVAGAVADHQVVLPRVPCRISCTVAPENMDAPVVYTFSGEGSVFVLNPQTGEYGNVPGKRYEGGASIDFYWDRPGRKQINIRNPIGEPVGVELAVARLEGESFPVAVNMNDSDANGLADALQEKLEVNDPDIRKIHLFLECPGENGWRYHLGENVPEVISFFTFLKAREAKLEIRRNKNFQVWMTPFKQVPFLVNMPDPEEPDEMVYVAKESGNGEDELVFNAGTDTDVVRQFFDKLYVEGVSDSPEEQDSLSYSLTIGDKSMDVASRILCIRLKLVYAVDFAECGLIGHYSKINTIVNPAVILQKSPGEMAAPENEVAKFMLAENTEQDFLQNNEHDLIEWNVISKPGESVALRNGSVTSLGDPNGGVADFYEGRRTGYSVGLYGTHPGFVTIGVKVKGAPVNYMEFTALVQPERFLPVCFQFFVAESNVPERVHGFIASVPDILYVCNILARQSGITLFSKDLSNMGNTAESMENYRAYLDFTGGPYPDQFKDFLKFQGAPVWLYRLPNFAWMKITDGEKVFFREPCSSITNIIIDNNIQFFLRREEPYAPNSIMPTGGVVWAEPDVPSGLPRELLNNVFVIKETPSWVTHNNGYLYTHLISFVPSVVNINFVENIKRGKSEGETSVTYINMIGLDQHNKATLPNEENGYYSPVVLRTPEQVFSGQFLPFAGTNLGTRRVFYENDYTLQKRKHIFLTAQVILHEVLHSMGLFHRAVLADDPDGIATKGMIPATDAEIEGEDYDPQLFNNPGFDNSELHEKLEKEEPMNPFWNNAHNIMTHFPTQINGYDIDLVQSIIIRQNLLLRNAPE